MSSRGIVVSILIGLVAVCVCALAIITAAGALVYLSSDNLALGPTPTKSPPTVTRDPDWTPAPAPTPGPTQIAAMDSIQQQVIALRGLQPTSPVVRRFMTAAELNQFMIDNFNEDTTPQEQQDDVRELAALGLITPDFDLYALLIRLYSEGVVGLYDPETDELFVRSEAGQLNAYEKVTFAHEYNHALQDQNYDQEAMGLSEEGWETDSERAAAVQALVEGDASLLEEQYKATLSRAEQREYDNVLNAFDLSILFEAPGFLLQDFSFPYTHGLEFVRRYYDAGGWARVDEIWRNPPVSTEHILHPERYEAGDLPALVARPALTDTLGAGWRQIESNVMGEWYTYLILAYGADPDTRLSDRTARQAAEGWGGDGYSVFYNDDTDQLVLALQWDWDTQTDADQFVRAFTDYGNQRFASAQTFSTRYCWNGEEINCFYFNGLHTLWITAPDQATLEAVLSQYPDF